MNATFRPSLAADIPTLAGQMRPEDREEVRASSGDSPVEALWRGFQFSSPCYTMVGAAGEILGMFGVIGGSRGLGVPWMLCTDSLRRYQMTFLRQGKAIVEKLNQEFPLLTNYVDARNKIHIRWLKWLGFKMVELDQEHGYEKRPFYRFERRLMSV